MKYPRWIGIGILFLFMCYPLLASKEFLLAPNGRHIPVESEAKALPKELTHLKPKARVQEEPKAVLDPGDFELRWNDGGTFYTFGFDDGDSMGLYLEPLAGAIMHEIYMYVTDFCGDVCFFLNDALYDGDASTSGACMDGGGWVGYYGHVVDGDTVWSTPGKAEFWVEGDNECWNQPPIGEEIWPGLGIGCYSVEITDENHSNYLVLDLGEVLGHPDTVWTPFFVLAAFDREDFAFCPDSWGIGAWDDVELPYHGFKYYDNLSRGEPGWWLRGFGWEVYTTVEYVEDIPPFIEMLPECFLSTTVSMDPREVCARIWDVNPTGSTPGGVTEALLWAVIDETDTTSIMMTANDDTFCAEIPGALPGQTVEWWISATDDNGNTSESGHGTYEIFQPAAPNLFVNNSSYPNWIDYYYLFGVSAYGEWPHDVWDGANYGPGTYELYSNYVSVVDAQGGGPNMCSSGLDTWLDEGGHYYLITGDEYLGACFYGWPGPLPIHEGDFAYDYLGLTDYYPDINYAASGDQNGVSRLFAIEGDPTSGDLFDFLADSLLLNYDPDYELGNDNWLDGVEVVDGAAISYWGLSGILDSLLAPPSDADTYAVAANITLSSGSKTAFFGFDALSLNTMGVKATALHGEGYHWIGVYPEGPIPMTLLNWGLILGLKDDVAGLPSKFALHQNYPNPFNPTTTIEFSVPLSGIVTLTVFDLLGREVETILNRRLNVGRHQVQWNAANFPSGIYFIRMQAGGPSARSGRGFSQTRKVTVLR